MTVTNKELQFKPVGERYKVHLGIVCFGWIQPFYFYGQQKPEWLFRLSPQAHLLTTADLGRVAGFLAAINDNSGRAIRTRLGRGH